jgi:DNA-binding response OmpR family regulator
LHRLTGKKILLVEDEVLIAEMVVDMLEGLGATVIGPATSLETGLSLAGSEDIDAAVLDVNLRGKRIDPIAEVLIGRGVPVVFATGYGKAAGTARGNAEAIDKPYTQDRLATALWRAMTSPQAAGSNA